MTLLLLALCLASLSGLSLIVAIRTAKMGLEDDWGFYAQPELDVSSRGYSIRGRKLGSRGKSGRASRPTSFGVFGQA